MSSFSDENIEFLNILSYCMASENLITITLPYQSKLNQIPLMILHGANIVRVIKGNMAGDPYNGISPDCNIWKTIQGIKEYIYKNIS